MNELVRKVVAHKLNDLEPLLEMQALLISRDVNALVEMIRPVSVNGGGYVTRRIKGRAVRFENEAGRHVVFGEVDDRRSVVYFQKSLFSEKINLLLHFVRIERFAGVAVEINSEAFVRLVTFVKRNFDKPFPELRVFGVTLLQLCKLSAGAIVERGVFFGFLVEFYVQAHKLVNAELFDGRPVAPELICRYLLAELRSPVAEMIYADAFVTAEFVQLFQRMTYNSRCKMTYMKRLADVRRGIVQNNGLSRSHRAFAVFPFFGKNFGDKLLRIIIRGDIKIQITADRLDSSDFGKGELLFKLGSDHHGAFAQRFAQLEARQSDIAHRAVRRVFEHCLNIARRKSFGFRNGGCNQFFDFCHNSFSLYIFSANHC